ncbi:prepilin-type N-terminal cleavage/methylation domain-containing protein [Propionivibrio limicola]|uniref:prepilin-type N-terminal cleavage/methylation domain-containing protein n=1 Tax=Propionivibrio limicola TaxID=167645 RepID=UPI0012912B4D|nr:type II secretion system protein [Propionivibrio limicola]
MKHTQQGFTLIELVVVIVILGILAATALPKFISMTDEADKAAIEAVAGAITGASNLNYAKCKSGGTCVNVSDTTDACAGAANSVLANQTNLLTGSITLQSGAATAKDKAQIEGGTPKACSSGTTVQCTIKRTLGSAEQSATAYVACTN